MSYTLQKECTVVLVYKGRGYHFDALSQFDFNQTFNKVSGSRKTLHSKKANPYMYANSKSAASFSFSVLATDTFSEGVLFELMGLQCLDSHVYAYPEELSINPETCSIYIITKGGSHKLSIAALESLEVAFSIGEALTFNASFTASNLEQVMGYEMSSGLIKQGNPLLPTPIQLQLDNLPNKSIINSGISMQQTIDWRDDRSLHTTEEVYVFKEPILTERSVGLNVSTYLRSDYKIKNVPCHFDVEVYKSGLSFFIQNAMVTKRIAPADVFTESYDISVTDQTKKLTVEYGGYIL